MDIIDFRKETSERSERQNWVLDELSASSEYYYAGFEGCNEDSSYLVTAIMDRAAIVVSGDLRIPPNNEDVRRRIESIEGSVLYGKQNFCKLLGITYTYVLYNYANGFVLRYEFRENDLYLVDRYESFAAFSQWIQSIKRWSSGKDYMEPGLPKFDLELRLAGCAWPTNIDCVVYNKHHFPVALLEFQNAKNTGVKNHSNNSYYYPYWDKRSSGYKSDEQRWRSQEIIRLQSGLPHLTIVWSQSENFMIVKQLQIVCFPYNEEADDYYNALIEYRDLFIKTKNNVKNKMYYQICQKYSSYHLSYSNGVMSRAVFNPPLSYENKSFPFIYGCRYDPCLKGSVKDGFEQILETVSNK